MVLIALSQGGTLLRPWRYTGLVWTRIEPIGAAPPPRWRHTCTAISRTQLLVFGGFESSTARLNDLWVYDVETRAWVRPAEQRADSAAVETARQRMLRGGRPPTAGSLPPSRSVLAPLGERRGAAAAGLEGLADLGLPISSTASVRASSAAPSPRGSHSAVLIDDNVWVFGGYGGTGYQRHDFNDLYRLNIPAMAWTKVDAPAGTPVPAPRSGHVAVASRSKMLVHGGWSSASQFNDLWAFDTEALAWSRVGASGPSRWNHAAVCGERAR